MVLSLGLSDSEYPITDVSLNYAGDTIKKKDSTVSSGIPVPVEPVTKPGAQTGSQQSPCNKKGTLLPEIIMQ